MCIRDRSLKRAQWAAEEEAAQAVAEPTDQTKRQRARLGGLQATSEAVGQIVGEVLFGPAADKVEQKTDRPDDKANPDAPRPADGGGEASRSP